MLIELERVDLDYNQEEDLQLTKLFEGQYENYSFLIGKTSENGLMPLFESRVDNIEKGEKIELLFIRPNLINKTFSVVRFVLSTKSKGFRVKEVYNSTHGVQFVKISSEISSVF